MANTKASQLGVDNAQRAIDLAYGMYPNYNQPPMSHSHVRNLEPVGNRITSSSTHARKGQGSHFVELYVLFRTSKQNTR
ncbi:hypothetical protein IG631_13457 [Alternaria alternata]|nr:hypothetical protein IG631_13457 [Alternaria alternata]